jgi:N-acetylglutamate synthase-like GNAT family acetyltransferase
MQWQQGKYLISTDKSLLDITVIHPFINHSYWAKNIPLETMKAAISGSMCFGVYLKGADESKQIGFARMITDKATFAYLADVFILPAHRGQGLSKGLIECILAHSELQGLRRILLATADAHGLYQQYGFSGVSKPESLMTIHDPNIYRQKIVKDN